MSRPGLVIHDMFEIEATERIVAGRHERTDSRTTERNGYKPKLAATQSCVSS